MQRSVREGFCCASLQSSQAATPTVLFGFGMPMAPSKSESCGIEAQDHLVDLTILGSQWDPQEDDDDAVDEPPARD